MREDDAPSGLREIVCVDIPGNAVRLALLSDPCPERVEIFQRRPLRQLRNFVDRQRRRQV